MDAGGDGFQEVPAGGVVDKIREQFGSSSC